MCTSLERLTVALLGGASKAYKVGHVSEEATQIDNDHVAVIEGIQQTKAKIDIPVKEDENKHSYEDLPLKEVKAVDNSNPKVYAFSGAEIVHIEFAILHKFNIANEVTKRLRFLDIFFVASKRSI